jgi:excisionase family DNA binding protein
MPKLLTPQQIADYLGVKPSTIYQWTHQGFIPHVKLGRLVRFREKTVMEWIAKREDRGRKTRKLDSGRMEF